MKTANFADRLINEAIVKKTAVVMGLDPTPEKLPACVPGRTPAARMESFCRTLIDAAGEFVCAVKPQLAYFEAYGEEGLHAFAQTVRYARAQGIPVIADAKRGDIGTTAAAYARAFLADGDFASDAVTVNPYLGEDGIIPFRDAARENGRGIFVLVKTSNPSSGRFQDIPFPDGEPMYAHAAALVNEMGAGDIGDCGYSSVGAVVGATYPHEAEKLRRLMPHALILVPGYGAQGGTADSAAVCFDANGLGAVVNASRSIMYAYASEKYKADYSEKSFASASAAEAHAMRDAINLSLERRRVQ